MPLADTKTDLLLPLNKVHHDVSGCWPLNFHMDILPGHPRTHASFYAWLTGLVKVSKVFVVEGSEEWVVWSVVPTICNKNYM
jgi:hypothetical protein